jgi:hypothetical protein
MVADASPYIKAELQSAFGRVLARRAIGGNRDGTTSSTTDTQQSSTATGGGDALVIEEEITSDEVKKTEIARRHTIVAALDALKIELGGASRNTDTQDADQSPTSDFPAQISNEANDMDLDDDADDLPLAQQQQQQRSQPPRTKTRSPSRTQPKNPAHEPLKTALWAAATHDDITLADLSAILDFCRMLYVPDYSVPVKLRYPRYWGVEKVGKVSFFSCVLSCLLFTFCCDLCLHRGIHSGIQVNLPGCYWCGRFPGSRLY